MKRYFRIMLGRSSIFAPEAHAGGYVGVNWFQGIDLSNHLPENWRDFNKEFIPAYLQDHPEKSKVAAGLSCGFTWTVCKGIKQGDIVLSPNGKGHYYVGEVASDYLYVPGGNLPHRRKVSWYPDAIDRSAMSLELRRSTGSIGTISEVTQYAAELVSLISSPANFAHQVTEDIEDDVVFALESQLKEFLVANWAGTDLGKKYDIFEDEGERVGIEYPTDTGRMDILAIRKDGKELLVVELKRGRVSDVVVGQVQRYMGYVTEVLADKDQSVRGAIIGLEDDLNLRRALVVTRNIEFFRYEIKFKLLSTK
jgi:restriction system protein